ncbi:carbohydrate kinase family protein, partial [Francisella tularensis subsp. holarctica]|nr:carbohydrate kinase family protein [Francisella tularensis subsp. holarctica]
VAINPGSSQLSVGESFIKDSMFGFDILVLNFQEAQKLMLSLLSSDDKVIVESKDRLETPLCEEKLECLKYTFRIIHIF